jgi:hypothetical protein
MLVSLTKRHDASKRQDQKELGRWIRDPVLQKTFWPWRHGVCSSGLDRKMLSPFAGR